MSDHLDLPDNRVKSLEELYGLRGRPIYVVTQVTTTPVYQYYPMVHVQQWRAGPILIDYGLTFAQATSNRYSLYAQNRLPRSGCGRGASFFLAENGDWNNDARRKVSLLNLNNFMLDRSPFISENSHFRDCIFTDKEDATVWAVMCKLASNEVDQSKRYGRFSGCKEEKNRKQIKLSLET